MSLDLTAINLALDALIKIFVLGILVFLVIILKHLDQAVQSASRSADSVHGLAQKLHSAMSGKSLLKLAHKYFLKRIEKGEN